MTELSLAAQAVWSSYEAILEHECVVTKTDMKALAAALLAAADQVVPPEQETPWGSIVQAHAAELRIRNELLAIATELESHD